jgi:hypothetical protein
MDQGRQDSEDSHRSETMIIEDDLCDRSKLSAEDLARRLRDHFVAVGGLTCAGEVEIAREAVRRARRAEWAEAELRQREKRRPA